MNVEREKRRLNMFMEATQTSAPSLAKSKRAPIWHRNKATLWYYPTQAKKYQTPLFLIYSLVNQPTILDLTPEHSFIGALTQAGYDVYLIDFGIPGYEDSDWGLADYIHKYIQPGVRQALTHANSTSISIIGFCLGGTLAAMYAAVAQEPIENLLLLVTPIDFTVQSSYDQWLPTLAKDPDIVNDWIDALGVIPAAMMKWGVRLLTSPLYISPYLALWERGMDEQYVTRWRQFQDWAQTHIPFPGTALKDFLHEVIISNKLVRGELLIESEPVKLENIQANLLVMASEFDQLVPLQQAEPIMNLVSSEDKQFVSLPVGHTGLSLSSKGVAYFLDWLAPRSMPLSSEEDHSR